MVLNSHDKLEDNTTSTLGLVWDQLPIAMDSHILKQVQQGAVSEGRRLNILVS